MLLWAVRCFSSSNAQDIAIKEELSAMHEPMHLTPVKEPTLWPVGGSSQQEMEVMTESPNPPHTHA